MAEAPFIKRRPADAEPDGFAELRRVGIELAQQFSGELWSDYNLHDPGVTILEQLAYAVTELGYRSDFPVADLLSGEQGIDYPRQALYAPEQVFPCRPTSLLDYRKALLDALAELDNCWLQPLAPADGPAGRGDGLYRILLKVDPGLEAQRRAELLRRVEQWYQANRNLCEDLVEVSFVKEMDVELCARVEVEGSRRPVDILADIYFAATRRIAGAVVMRDYAQALAAGDGLEEIFSGPSTDKGLLDDEELAAQCREFLVSNLFAVINQVDGVRHIDSLCLQRDGRSYYDSVVCNAAESALHLHSPRDLEEIKVELIADGRSIAVEPESLRARLDELHFRYYASRSTPQDISALYALPAGGPRQGADYYSIQHQFPAVYGIGAFGVPESAPPERKAKARQLQGYLLIFEQLMANFLANLNAIPELFSLDGESPGSYRWMPLREGQINGLDALYAADPAALAAILAGFDDPLERRNRLLDYLLALYGEAYPGDALRHFSGYFEPREVERRVIEGKLEFLRSVVELGRDRAAAGNLGGGGERRHQVSGLQRRVALQLGFQRADGGSLVQGILELGLKLARHQTYEHLKRGSSELQFIEQPLGASSNAGQLQALPLWQEADGLSPKQLQERIGDTIPFCNGLLSDRLLRQGTQLGAYRLCAGTDRDWRLCLQTEAGQLWQLGCYPEREQAVQAGNCLRRLLIHLNRVGEGLHLIEHILLRPLGEHAAGQPQVAAGLAPAADFYPFRISLLFPAWSARCHDAQFRLQAEETVRRNTPAHIYAQCHWLDFYEMYEFEGLYDQWLELRGDAQADAAELDRASARLVRFLLQRSGNTHGGECP